MIDSIVGRSLICELRKMLLDVTRAGTQLDDKAREFLIPRQWPEEPWTYIYDKNNLLVLADTLEELDDELAELVRIQVELTNYSRPACMYFSRQLYGLSFDGLESDLRFNPHRHPYEFDLLWSETIDMVRGIGEEPPKTERHVTALLRRRLEIVKSLYPQREVRIDERVALSAYGKSELAKRTRAILKQNHFRLNQPIESKQVDPRMTVFRQPRQLGRTTRMLLDAINWASQDSVRHILIKCDDPDDTQVEQQALQYKFNEVATELGHEPSWIGSETAMLFGTNIVFGGQRVTHIVETQTSEDPREGFQFSIERGHFIQTNIIEPHGVFLDHTLIPNEPNQTRVYEE